MLDDDALLALAPLAGLAAYCLTHLIACRVAGRRGPYPPLLAGFLAGLAAGVAVSLWAMAGSWEKGTVPICRDGPKGASHKWGLSPFSRRTWPLFRQ